MNVPELRTRHTLTRLKYAGKLLTMEKGRLARAVIIRSPTAPWWRCTKATIAAHPVLREGFRKLQRSADRNHGVVPMGIDSTVDLDIDYTPLRSWRKTVEQWAANRTLTNFRRERGSTLSLLQRAVEPSGNEVDIDQMPRFPLTRLANHGPDQIRLRFLSGTSALNATLSKWSDRESLCPFAPCNGTDGNGKENALHFLLHCGGVAELRTHYRGQLKRKCTCEPAASCDKFFTELDDAGKALFILGGPVNGRTPEASIDACSRHFVRSAWKARCCALTSKNPDASVVDLTVGNGSVHGQTSSRKRSGPRSERPSSSLTTPTPRSDLITAYFSRTPAEDPCSNLITVHPSRSPAERSRIAQWTLSTTTRANVSDPRQCHNGSGPYVLSDKGSG